MGDMDSFSCLHSPMDSPYAVAVGALDSTGQFLHGSNFGDCVDLYAPGEEVPAPWIGPSDTETSTLTGTSASAAIVTGLAARLMSRLRAPSLTYDKLKSSAYAAMKSLVRAEDFTVLVRNILLTPSDDGIEGVGSLCLYSEGHSGLAKIVNQELADLDKNSGKPQSFQRLKYYRNLNQREERERYYLG